MQMQENVLPQPNVLALPIPKTIPKTESFGIIIFTHPQVVPNQTFFLLWNTKVECLK